jgi:hypothetical protein
VWEWSSNIPGLDLSQVRGTSLSLSGRELVGKVEVGKVSRARGNHLHNNPNSFVVVSHVQVRGTSLSLSGRELVGKVEVGKVSRASDVT